MANNFLNINDRYKAYAGVSPCDEVIAEARALQANAEMNNALLNQD